MVTRDTDYAIRALCCIAQAKEKVVSARYLTKELKIPRPFLRKILQILNKKKILKSYKGLGGGFSLAENIKNITVFDLVNIFQGPFALTEHKFKGKECPYTKRCKLKKRLDSIESDVIKKLRSINLADLLK
ncbi:MAG: RrF2 family transcriptional regulator [Candidatus Omnitrophota bacterium]